MLFSEVGTSKVPSLLAAVAKAVHAFHKSDLDFGVITTVQHCTCCWHWCKGGWTLSTGNAVLGVLHSSQCPCPIFQTFDTDDYVVDATQRADFGFNRFEDGVSAHAW